MRLLCCPPWLSHRLWPHTLPLLLMLLLLLLHYISRLFRRRLLRRRLLLRSPLLVQIHQYMQRQCQWCRNPRLLLSLSLHLLCLSPTHQLTTRRSCRSRRFMALSPLLCPCPWKRRRTPPLLPPPQQQQQL